MNTKSHDPSEEYRDLAEGADLGLFRVTSQGEIVLATKRWAQLCGLTLELGLGRLLWEVFEDLPQRSLARKLAAPGRETLHFQLSPSARQPPLELTLRRQRRGTDWVGSLQDTTRRSQTERILRTAKEAAETANDAKSAFLASVSHEIRTPLTSILGYSELLEDERVSPSQRRTFQERVATSARVLLSLLDDVLDMTKVEAGQLVLEDVPSNPFGLAQEVLDSLEGTAKAKGLELRLEGAADMSALLDPDRVRQILLNVTGNAIKFTPEGEVVLRLTKSSEPERLVFSISDSGPGIAGAEIDSIFEPFTRGSSRGQSKGTGLGLAIARRVAEALSGSLSVSETSPAGSTFRLELPYRPAEPPPSSSPLPDLCSKRILIADDNVHARVIVRTILEGAGAQVNEAEDGLDCLDIWNEAQAKQVEIDAIVLDVDMPELDGCMTARLLRRAGASCLLIALTAHAFTADRDRCLRAGFNAYLSKPILEEDLLGLLSQALQETAPEDDSRETRLVCS